MPRKQPTPATVPGTGSPDREHLQARTQHRAGPVVVRRVNGRLLVVTFIAALVFGLGTYGLHAFMVDRNADRLLIQADAAEREGEYGDAAGHVARYLQFRPHDVEALERLAGLLRRTANSRQVWAESLASLEQVLRLDPSRVEARKAAAETALKLRKFGDARSHLEELFKSPEYAADASLMLSAARAEAGEGRVPEATARFLTLIDRHPETVAAYAELAELLVARPSALPNRQQVRQSLSEQSQTRVIAGQRGDAGLTSEESVARNAAFLLFPERQGEKAAGEVADALLELMVADGRPAHTAYLARANHLFKTDRLELAAADLRQAAADPNASADSDVLSTAAMVEVARAREAAARGDTDAATKHRTAARDYVEAGLKADLPEPQLYLILADLTLDEVGAKDRNEALKAAVKQLRLGLEKTAEARRALTPGQFDEAERLVETETKLRWTLTDLLLDRMALQTDPAAEKELRSVTQTEMTALHESGCRPEMVELLACRLLLQDRRVWEAVSRLEKIRISLVAIPEMRRRVDLMLGSAYDRLNNPGRQVETYRRAVADDPLWTLARVRLAEALATTGRSEEAIREYRTAGTYEAAIAAARLALIEELRTPPENRDFSTVEQILRGVEQQPPTAAVGAAAAVIRAQMLLARGDVEGAGTMLAQASARYPDVIALWLARVNLEIQRLGVEPDQRLAKLDELIREADARFGDRAETRLAKVEAARLRGADDLKAEIRRQAEGAESLGPAERLILFESLIQHAGRAGERDLVADLWRKVLTIDPDSLQAWMALAAAAAESDDQSAGTKALNAIRRIEGPDGPNGNYIEAALRLNAIARDKTLLAKPQERAAAVAGPRRALLAAAEQRPYWPHVHKLLGNLESFAGDSEQAFEHFERAFRLGDRSTETVRSLVSYYYGKQRFDEADAIIRQVEREKPGAVTGDLAKAAAQIATSLNQPETAIDWAMRAVGFDDETGDRIAEAHRLFTEYAALTDAEKQGDAGAKLLKEAGTLYRQAVDRAPGVAEAWLAYVVHLKRVGDVEAAKAVIKEAEVKLPAEPAAPRLAALAQFYEIVEMPDEAARHYEQAIAAAPSDPRYRIAAVRFFGRVGRLDDAKVHIDFLLDPKNKAPASAVAWAERSHAVATAASGRYEDVRRALDSFQDEAGTPEEAATDLRAQLAILAGRSSTRDLRDRIRILEEIRGLAEKAPEKVRFDSSDTLQLAGLYAVTGAWPQARPLYEELLAQDGADDAALLSQYLVHAAEYGEPDAAAEDRFRSLLDRLRSSEPESIRTAVVSARVLNAFGRNEEAAAALVAHADRAAAAGSPGGAEITAEERAEIGSAAEVAEALELQETAESLFRRVAASERPEDAFALATYLGRQGRYAEALDICERSGANAAPAATAVTATNIISLGPVPPDQLDRAERLVTTALRAEPQSLHIITSAAGLRTVQGRYDEAERLYRQILAEQPENVAVLNNLAWLLAITGQKTDEAAQLIDHAIRISGPVAALIDTRATVRLARKAAAEAIADLDAAYEQSPTPSVAFHRALAYAQLGNLDAAREQLRIAHEGGLSLRGLHAAEHDAYRKLLMRLGTAESET